MYWGDDYQKAVTRLERALEKAKELPKDVSQRGQQKIADHLIQVILITIEAQSALKACINICKANAGK